MPDFVMPEKGTDLWCARCRTMVGQVTCPDPGGVGYHKLLCGPRITVDAIVRVSGDRFVLVRRKGGRAEGKLALPGGFVDLDERCIPAVAREVEEEAGIAVSLEAWELVGIYEYGQNNMAMVYAAEWAGDDPPQPGPDHPEVAEVVCLRPDEIDERRAELAYDHGQMLADYLAGRRRGLRWI